MLTGWFVGCKPFFIYRDQDIAVAPGVHMHESVANDVEGKLLSCPESVDETTARESQYLILGEVRMRNVVRGVQVCRFEVDVQVGVVVVVSACDRTEDNDEVERALSVGRFGNATHDCHLLIVQTLT